MSCKEIAKIVGVNKCNITRKMHKHQFKLRTPEEEKEIGIKRGKQNGTKKGHKRSDKYKFKNSDSCIKRWAKISDEERKLFGLNNKLKWEAKTDEEKAAIRAKLKESFKDIHYNGSALEKFIVKWLKTYGYEVEFHKRHTLFTKSIKVDIFLPKLRIFIQCEGPIFYQLVATENKLERKLEITKEENELISKHKMMLIRVKQGEKCTLHIKRKILNAIFEVIHKVEDCGMPPKSGRLVEISIGV